MRVARWRTPSWEDVNTEVMNRYYTKMPDERRTELARMRGAHNLWYVYARPGPASRIRKALEAQLVREDPRDRYAFEEVLDECGFGYLQTLESDAREPLWHVSFD